MTWPASVVVHISRPDEASRAAAASLSTATVHEAAGCVGALPAAIKPLDRTWRLCGPAVTVSLPPGDNLRLHHAMYVAEPGDVLVVDCSGAHEHGYWGEIMTVAARARGLGGLVIDACVRDGDRLIDVGFPVFARGLCIQGTVKNPAAPGSINHPVRVGQTDVHPGDLVIGDADGVVVVPRQQVVEVTEKAIDRETREAELLALLRAGRTTLELFGFDPDELT